MESTDPRYAKELSVCEDRREVRAREAVYEVDRISVVLEPDVVKQFDEYAERESCFR